jgi:hypothetical protein
MGPWSSGLRVKPSFVAALVPTGAWGGSPLTLSLPQRPTGSDAAILLQVLQRDRFSVQVRHRCPVSGGSPVPCTRSEGHLRFERAGCRAFYAMSQRKASVNLRLSQACLAFRMRWKWANRLRWLTRFIRSHAVQIKPKVR